MKPSTEQLAGLNVALNEARLLAFDYDLMRRTADVTLMVLTLPEQGPPPEDARIQLHLWPVGRIAASFLDRNGKLTRLGLGDLSEVVGSFEGQPIYGWEFFRREAFRFEWFDRLSLDFTSGDAGREHTLHLFQEDGRRSLDVCAWFGELEVRDTTGREIQIDAFIADGKRWWDGVFAGDPRTRASGIHPLKE